MDSPDVEGDNTLLLVVRLDRLHSKDVVRVGAYLRTKGRELAAATLSPQWYGKQMARTEMMRKGRGNGIVVCTKLDGGMPKMGIARDAYVFRHVHIQAFQVN